MENEFKTLMVLQAQCPKCKDWIYSRAQHDFHYCTCKNIAVDGGHWDDVEECWVWERFIGNYSTTHQRMRSVTADERMLWNDWNNSDDKFGLIKGD